MAHVVMQDRGERLAWAGRCLEEGRAAEAIQHYGAVVRHDPDDVPALLGLSRALLAAGCRPDAAARLEADANRMIERGAHQSALALLGELMQLEPARLDLHLDVAGIERDMGNLEAALLRCDQVAEAYLAQGDEESATEVLMFAAGWEDAPAHSTPPPSTQDTPPAGLTTVGAVSEYPNRDQTMVVHALPATVRRAHQAAAGEIEVPNVASQLRAPPPVRSTPARSTKEATIQQWPATPNALRVAYRPDTETVHQIPPARTGNTVRAPAPTEPTQSPEPATAAPPPAAAAVATPQPEPGTPDSAVPRATSAATTLEVIDGAKASATSATEDEAPATTDDLLARLRRYAADRDEEQAKRDPKKGKTHQLLARLRKHKAVVMRPAIKIEPESVTQPRPTQPAEPETGAQTGAAEPVVAESSTQLRARLARLAPHSHAKENTRPRARVPEPPPADPGEFEDQPTRLFARPSDEAEASGG